LPYGNPKLPRVAPIFTSIEPSANRFGRISPTTAEHVRADLGAEVDAIIDGGRPPGPDSQRSAANGGST
jgi:tRNA A37 threonylcarbamoyladenosine synthetase subunit TsaC/SUA5/YrdC